MSKFLGRKQELEGLKGLLKKKVSSLVVLRGRRRIGKSRLAEEFAKEFSKHYIFSGLPPSKKTTQESQCAEFRRQMNEKGIPHYSSNDWGDLFSLVANHCASGQVLVVLDEITWMGSKDPDFLGKLKIVWDLHLKKNPQLILIISGSNSIWIEKNILSSTSFMGRVSHRILLKELPLSACNQFWKTNQTHISSYEKFKILAVTGGVPRYLEEVIPSETAEKNIQRLGFTNTGVLFTEFDNIFTDLFNGRHEKYREIVKCLTNGHASLEKIAQKLGRAKGGDLSDALKDLEESGFLARDYSWSIKNGIATKRSYYRLRDNYTRFYLRYIEPSKNNIEKGTLQNLPASWLSIMGLQFENLVLNNLPRLIDILKIPTHELVTAGPYLQTQTQSRSKCQIDLMIQTKFNQLYICEIKFSKREIGPEIVNEMKQKISALQYPKGFSCRPVLIHVNEVSERIEETEYFSQIINFSEFLSSS